MTSVRCCVWPTTTNFKKFSKYHTRKIKRGKDNSKIPILKMIRKIIKFSNSHTKKGWNENETF
jgi:hypothetical protein